MDFAKEGPKCSCGGRDLGQAVTGTEMDEAAVIGSGVSTVLLV